VYIAFSVWLLHMMLTIVMTLHDIRRAFRNINSVLLELLLGFHRGTIMRSLIVQFVVKPAHNLQSESKMSQYS